MKTKQLVFLLFICLACTYSATNIIAAAPILDSIPPNTKIVISEESIDKVVNDALKTFNVPGLAVGLVIDDQIILSKGYGTCKVNEVLPVTERTVFPIASVSKAFTALLLGQLVDEGKLSFDDPIIKYVPELSLMDPDATINMTIRDLLAHRTGIARQDTIWVCLPIGRSDVVPLLKHLEPACALREKFYYNNFMYALAGIVLERVTGESWEEFLSSRLLNPIGMDDTTATFEELVNCSNVSFPHAHIDGITTTLTYRDLFAVNPAMGINSTVVDMIKWMKLQLSVKDYSHIICRNTLDEMFSVQISLTPSTTNPLIQSGYGLGWFLGTYRDCPFVGHGGDRDGFSSDVSLLPADGVGLVILANSSTDGRSAITSIRGQIFDKILGEEDFPWLSEMQSAQIKARQELQAALERFDESILNVDTDFSFEDFIGTYEHPSYGNYEISLENGSLVATYGSTITQLYLKSGDILTGKLNLLLVFGINPVIDITFQRNSSGEICGVQVPFEAFRSLKPITFKRVGNYSNVPNPVCVNPNN